MHALDPVQYSYNAEYLSAVTRTVGFYIHLYVALNVWANVWAETSYSCISVIFNLCAKQRTPKCVRRRVVQDRHQERRQCMPSWRAQHIGEALSLSLVTIYRSG